MTEREIPYTYRFVKCQKCGREFLVERLLLGIDHTIDVIVSCKECLKKRSLPKDFIKKHPNEAGAIMTWLKGKTS